MSQNPAPYRILLVEDDNNIARLFEYTLSRAGYVIEHCSNGKEAFDITKSFNPDLIISDIMMPEVDGFEYRRMLLEEPDLRSIPFIFLTAKGSEEDILTGYDMDIQEYIIKTSSPKVVLAKVSAIIKSHEIERQKAQSEVQKAADTMSAKVVPDEAPSLDGFLIKHWHVPFHQIPGGDFIDYVKIDDDRLVIVLGDVMGKKWGAWYFAVAYAGYVRSAVRIVAQSEKSLSAKELVNKVNESIFHDERIADVFVTLSIIVINKNNKSITYCGAGDLPLLFHSKAEVTKYKSEGLLLGFNLDGGYQNVKINMESNDEIILITDGIIESRNEEGNQLEIEGLIEIIKNNDSEDMLEKIRSEFHAFTKGNYEDDVSLIYIKAQ